MHRAKLTLRRAFRTGKAIRRWYRPVYIDGDDEACHWRERGRYSHGAPWRWRLGVDTTHFRGGVSASLTVRAAYSCGTNAFEAKPSTAHHHVASPIPDAATPLTSVVINNDGQLRHLTMGHARYHAKELGAARY